MFTKLIGLGLFIIPFFVWPGFDTRQPKLFLALVFSLVLGLYAFWKGYFKPYKNIWLLLFLGFILINFVFSPQNGYKFAGVEMSSWVLEAFLYIIIFFLAHASISGYQFTKEEKYKLLNIMVLAGSIMSLYAVAQWFGYEQFFSGNEGGTRATCGTLGTPRLLSPFLGMIIPLALYLKKYIQAALMLIVIFLVNSQVAYISTILALMFLLGTKSKKLMFIMIGIFVFLSLILAIGFCKSNKIHDFVGGGNGTGRFPQWKQIVNDIKTPLTINNKESRQYSLTGYGLGSFKYLYHLRHRNPGDEWFEAHNDYLELFYNTGLIGICLFLMGLGYFIYQCFPLNELNAHLLSSFICIAICAGGIFVWQNGATIFYTLIITGLLVNKEASCKEKLVEMK